ARLLEGVSISKELCLRKVEAEEFGAHGNAKRRARGRWGKASRESNSREAGPVRKRSVALRLVLRRHWHHQNSLMRVNDRIEVMVGHCLCHSETQLVAVEHAVLVGLAFHAVDNGNFLFECRLYRRSPGGYELGEALDWGERSEC